MTRAALTTRQPALLLLISVAGVLLLVFLFWGERAPSGDAAVPPGTAATSAPGVDPLRLDPLQPSAEGPPTRATLGEPATMEAGAGKTVYADEPSPSILSGTVVDAVRSGEPVPGASVLLDDAIAPRARAQTDDQGRFQMRLPPRGVGILVVRAEGYRFTQWYGIDLDQLQRDDFGLILPLVPGAKLRGKVLDNHGEPVTPGVVFAYGQETWTQLGGHRQARMRAAGKTFEALELADPRNEALYKEGKLPWTYANHSSSSLSEEGTFALLDLRPDTPLYLYVDAEQARPEFHKVILSEGEEREITLLAQRAPVIRGRAMVPDFEGLTYPGVWFCVHEPHRRALPGRDRWSPIAKDGSFSSGPLWPAEEVKMYFTFEINDASGLSYFEKEMQVRLGEEEILELEVDLSDARQSPILPERVRR